MNRKIVKLVNPFVLKLHNENFGSLVTSRPTRQIPFLQNMGWNLGQQIIGQITQHVESQ